VADTVGTWLAFADALGYRLVLSDDCRVLLGLSGTFARTKPKKEHREVEVMLGLIRDTCAVTDRFAGASAKEPPPCVILCARTADYAKVVGQIGSIDPRLKDWSERAGAAAMGFVLSDPLVAAWIEDPVGVQEWHPYNELVHRTAQLIIRERAPRVPAWLLLGLAWHVEDTVRGSIYCFPHRTSFVWATEHTDWGLWLANAFKKERRDKAKRPQTVGIDEFADWRPDSGRDEYDLGRAYISFGVARYLAHEHTAAVRSLAEKLSAAAEKGSRITVSPTEWRTDPDYHLPSAEQLALLCEIDEQLLAKVTGYFQKRKANERRLASKKSR
jgi:hypothetical protein